MNTRQLGNTGIQVTRTSIGTIAFLCKAYGGVTEPEGRAILQAYIEKGGNFIDTARCYGESERVIGNFMRDENLRDKLVIASKIHVAPDSDPSTYLKKYREEMETSLRELQTDYIDLCYVHTPPEDIDLMNRVLDLFDEFKEEGKILSIGSSIKGRMVTQETVDLCRQYIRTGRIDALEVIYSLVRQKNREWFQEATDNNIAIIARTVTEKGYLSGNHKPGDDFKDQRQVSGLLNGALVKEEHELRDRLDNALKEVQDLKDTLVKPPYTSLAQVALRFVLDDPLVTSILPGATKVYQVKENMAVEDLPPLDPDLRAKLVRQFANRDDEFNI